MYFMTIWSSLEGDRTVFVVFCFGIAAHAAMQWQSGRLRLYYG